jgi:hypothetical protein
MGGVYAPFSQIASEKENSGGERPIGHRSNVPAFAAVGRVIPTLSGENFAKVLFLLRGLTLLG